MYNSIKISYLKTIKFYKKEIIKLVPPAAVAVAADTTGAGGGPLPTKKNNLNFIKKVQPSDSAAAVPGPSGPR
jgi:hypothetical protein